MDIAFWFKGLVIGFSIAAPVGPIGVLCIRRTLADGRAAGFLSGLGAATADAFYGCLAAFGVTFVSNLLLPHRAWLSLIGGLFLCYLGLKVWLAQPAQSGPPAINSGRLLRAYLSTLALTLTNPATILSFAAIFAGLGLGAAAKSYSSAATLVVGVFTGSALWWLILSGGVSFLRPRFSVARLRWVNRASGMIIGGFGLLVLLNLLR